MNRFYTLLILILVTPLSSLPAQQLPVPEDTRGYIVTLSGDRLTGSIGNITPGPYTNYILFINDFGTPYKIRAELIRGFAFRRGGEFVQFETHFEDDRCMFMKVILKGEGLCLYRSMGYGYPDPNDPTVPITYDTRKDIVPGSYYITRGNRQAMKVKRWGFRRNMRRILKERAPELAGKIGQKGYRFRDLEKIIKEYNEEYELTRFTL